MTSACQLSDSLTVVWPRVTNPISLTKENTIPNPKVSPRAKIQNPRAADAALAKKVALSCQILAKLGLFKETTGHVSARSADGANMLIRGRGREETGLLFTKASDVVLANFAGQRIQKSGILKPPNESVIHGEIYKARAAVGGIVHAHPASVVLTSMAGIDLRPIFGGYDPRAMRMASKTRRSKRSSSTHWRA